MVGLLSSDELIFRCEALFVSIDTVTYKEMIIEEKSYIPMEDDDAFSEAEVSSPDRDDDGVTSEYNQNDYIGSIGPPSIHGYASRYQIGDNLHLNCSSYYAYPPAYIEWFVNDREVIQTLYEYI